MKRNLTRKEWARTHLVLAVLLGACTGVAIGSGQVGWLPFVTWLASMAALLCAARLVESPSPGGRRIPAAELTSLLLVTGLAAFFRLHAITEIPYGFWVDELWNARNAVVLVSGETFAPFGTTPLMADRPGWVVTHNLYLYVSWLLQALGGFGDLGLRFVSTIPGVLAVPALYLTARSLYNPLTAWTVTGLFAASLWHVTLSRWGWDEVLCTTLVIVSFALASRSLTRGRCFPMICAGLVSGLSLYGYLAARVGLLAVLAFVIVSAPRERRFTAPLVFLAAVAVAGIPIFASWLMDPAAFAVRVAQVSIAESLLQGDVGVLGGNLLAHLLMFNVAGDPNPRHNLPGQPMLDPVVGVLFLAGVALSLFHWREHRSRLCLVWLGVGLLGGILSTPAEAPHAYRTGLVAPVCFLLVARAMAPLFAAIEKRTGSGFWISVALAVALVGTASHLTYEAYFQQRIQNPKTFNAMGKGVAARFVRERAAVALARGARVYVDDDLMDFHLETELGLLVHGNAAGLGRGSRPRRGEIHVVSMDGAALPFAAGDGEGAVLFFTRERRKAFRGRHPELGTAALMDGFGRIVAVAASADESLLAELLSLPPPGT